MEMHVNLLLLRAFFFCEIRRMHIFFDGIGVTVGYIDTEDRPDVAYSIS